MKKTFRSLLPFSNAHWTLPVVMWLAMACLLGWYPCSEKHAGVPAAMLTATVCIALWNSHIRERPIANWKLMARVLLGAVHDLLLLLIWLLPVVLLIPTECYTNRAKIQELLSLAVPMMAEVESRVKQQGSIVDSGAGLKVTSGKYLSGGVVSKDGTIVEISKEPPAVVMLVPEFTAGTVIWKCTGFPKEYMPKDCRD